MDSRYSDYVYSYTRPDAQSDDWSFILFIIMGILAAVVLSGLIFALAKWIVNKEEKRAVATVGKTLWDGKFPSPVKKNQLKEHSVFWYAGNAFVLWAVALYAVRRFLPEFDIILDNRFSIGSLIVCMVFACILCGVLKCPYVPYPYFQQVFDVSGRRMPQMESYIDDYLISEGFDPISKQYGKILDWHNACKAVIDRSTLLKNRRMKQYEALADDEHAFWFYFVRSQTRYQQRNYVRMPYSVDMITEDFFCDYAWLEDRDAQLQEINYECNLRDYHSKNQRRLMTKELREQIMERDNYTCQICGKYMPDRVGLHIDHIVPVSKGGKTVPSNLQVLCSVCNGHKSAS